MSGRSPSESPGRDQPQGVGVLVAAQIELLVFRAQIEMIEECHGDATSIQEVAASVSGLDQIAYRRIEVSRQVHVIEQIADFTEQFDRAERNAAQQRRREAIHVNRVPAVGPSRRESIAGMTEVNVGALYL